MDMDLMKKIITTTKPLNQNKMKKQTSILITSIVTILGYSYENYLMLTGGFICLVMVLISKKSKSKI